MTRSVLPDLLRATAVMAMIANHLAVRVAGENLDQGLKAILFQLGSFAPVLFFFTTGFGYGLQAKRKHAGSARARLVDAAFKLLLLLAADAMLWLGPQSGWHLDFLAFIGIASTIIVIIELLPASSYVVVTLLFLSLTVRFILGRGEPPISDGWSPIWQWCIGRPGIDGISYPLSPWIAFSLLGYLAGRHWDAAIQRAGEWVIMGMLTVGGCLSAAAAASLVSAGSPYFRWGTMSLAYFIASLAAIALSMSGCLAFTMSPRHWQKAACVDGLASLAVVPIHYLVIVLVVSAASDGNSVHPIVLFLCVAVASVIAARGAVFGIDRCNAVMDRRYLVVALAVAILSALLMLRAVVWPLPARLTIALIGQLSIVAFFANRAGKRQAADSAPVSLKRSAAQLQEVPSFATVHDASGARSTGVSA